MFRLIITALLASSCLGGKLSFQPYEIKSQNGKLEVTLDVNFVHSLHGYKYNRVKKRIGPGYNGGPIGPTLRVHPGDELIVHVVNNLPPVTPREKALYEYTNDPASDDATATIMVNRLSKIGNIYSPEYGWWGQSYVNMHFHGMAFPYFEEQLGTFIDGGERKTYKFKIREDMDPGLRWYHDHVHGTAVYSYMSGLFGFIIVEGTETDITKAPGVEGATEVLMMLTEALTYPNGVTFPYFPITNEFDWTGVTNGHLPEVTHYTFHQYEKALFRVCSATADPIIRLVLPGHTFVILARDARPLPVPEESEIAEVAAGARTEFLVRFDKPGRYVMKRLAWAPFASTVEECYKEFGLKELPCLSWDIEREVAIINVIAKRAPRPKKALIETVQLPPYSERLQNSAVRRPLRKRRILFGKQTGFPLFQIPYDGEFVPPGVGFGVDDRLYRPTYYTGTVISESCETWYVTSYPGNYEHSFHVHASPFLITHLEGRPVKYPEWRDSITLPATATLHICFDRHAPGETLLVHCHASTHIDMGMVANYKVIADPGSSAGGRKRPSRRRRRRRRRSHN